MEILEYLAGENRLSRNKLAKICGVNYRTVCNWYNGVSDPGYLHIERLVAYLGYEIIIAKVVTK